MVRGQGAADRRLAVADRAVPGLLRALDPDAMAEAAAAHLGLQVTAAEAIYARRKPGTSLVVVHRVHTLHGPVLVAAKAHREGDGAKLRKHLDRARRRHGPTVAADAGTGVLLRRWPADTALPGTKVLDRHDDRHDDPADVGPAAPVDVRPSVPTRVPGRDTPDWVCRAIGADVYLQPMRWKPSRRLVAALVDEHDHVHGTLKILSRARRARDGAAALGLLAGADLKRSTLVLRWVPGTPLDQCLAAATDPATAGAVGQRAGAALADLHHTACTEVAPLADPAAALHDAAEGTVNLLPDLAVRIRRLTAVVIPCLPVGGTALLHGDASADQLIVAQDGQIRPIDADEVGLGDPALDLGSILAALQLEVMAGRIEQPVADAAGTEMLEGYGAAGGCWDPATLAAAHAAGLLRRLGDPFKLRDPSWDVTAARLLEAAEAAAAAPDRVHQ